MTTLFELQEVRFGGILSYPDLRVREGGFTFIQGESGAGKSTLLKLFNGSLPLESGNLRYRGKDLQEWDTIALRREVLLVGQTVYLFDETIRENFREYYAYRDLPAPSEEHMTRFLRLCQAEFPLDTAAATMSGGERQRVYIAICLSFGPSVVLLDEPTSALDEGTAQRLMTGLKAHGEKEGITFIVVSHDQALTEAFADERITLEGRER